MASNHVARTIGVMLLMALLGSRVAEGQIAISLHPTTLAKNTTSRVLFTGRASTGPHFLATGDRIVFAARSNAPNGAVTLSNLSVVIATSDPVALGLQGTWTGSISGTDTITLTYTAGATNQFNEGDVVSVAADVTPNPAPPNGGEYPAFVRGTLIVAPGGVQGNSEATLAFVGFPVAPQGPPGDQGPEGPQGPQGSPGTSVTGVAEPSGANCAAGGVAYTSVSGTDFVCNGTMGGLGPMGEQGSQGPTGETGPTGASGGCSTTDNKTSLAIFVALLIVVRRRCSRLAKRVA